MEEEMMLKMVPNPTASRMARNTFDDLANICPKNPAVMTMFPNIIPTRRPNLSESHGAGKKAVMETIEWAATTTPRSVALDRP